MREEAVTCSSNRQAHPPAPQSLTKSGATVFSVYAPVIVLPGHYLQVRGLFVEVQRVGIVGWHDRDCGPAGTFMHKMCSTPKACGLVLPVVGRDAVDEDHGGTSSASSSGAMS
jgi:hypothetical protein